MERTHDNNVLKSECVERIDNAVELESGKVSVDASTSKKRRLSSGDVYWERMLACMKGKVKDDALVEDTLSQEENFAEFYNELCRESDSENITGVLNQRRIVLMTCLCPEGKILRCRIGVERGRLVEEGGEGLNWLCVLEME